ncbi:EF-hand [Ascodesmis nigricans]|uniref:EF-hand n=1 Tax=Ascodesmis nigricans TaxID=341454 RepID=A0A4S2N3S5_9PEZI|nr:EF-hand [Ascodesmis nigricans]
MFRPQPSPTTSPHTPPRSSKPSPLSYLTPSAPVSTTPRKPYSSPNTTTSPNRARTPSGALNQLSVSQISALKEAFTLLDKDGDGIISSEDLSSMLSSLGLDARPSACSKFLGSNAPFNLASFLTHLSTHLSSLSPPEELLAAFAAFDTTDDGTVNVAELRSGLTTMGIRMTDEEVDRALKGFTRRRLGGMGSGGEIFRYREWVDAVQGKGEREEVD